MQEGFTRKEKLVGVFLLVMMIFTMVTLLVIAQGKGWFMSQNTYLVKFKQGYNLHPGSLVKMFNAEIGKVSNMHITETGGLAQVQVTIKVNKEYAKLIRQDSVAEVVSPTIIGSEYLEISPGSPGYPKIEPYGTIPSRERQSLTEQLQELVNQETIQKVRFTLDNIAQLSEQLKNDEKALLAVANHANQVLVSLTEAKGTLGLLLMQKDLYTRMVQNLGHLDQLLVEAKNLTGDFRPSAQDLQTFTKSITEEIEPLKAIVANIKASSEDLPDLVREATETARSGKEVMDAIKANPLIRLTAPKEPRSRSIHVEPRNLP
ncbi:MAG: MlaD family protein [Deltaproteobacteria bacterium]|jgi:phospholipid/cholesterol/gamma-HCH transport system substrate-binding protein